MPPPFPWAAKADTSPTGPGAPSPTPPPPNLPPRPPNLPPGVPWLPGIGHQWEPEAGDDGMGGIYYPGMGGAVNPAPGISIIIGTDGSSYVCNSSLELCWTVQPGVPVDWNNPPPDATPTNPQRPSPPPEPPLLPGSQTPFEPWTFPEIHGPGSPELPNVLPGDPPLPPEIYRPDGPGNADAAGGAGVIIGYYGEQIIGNLNDAAQCEQTMGSLRPALGPTANLQYGIDQLLAGANELRRGLGRGTPFSPHASGCCLAALGQLSADIDALIQNLNSLSNWRDLLNGQAQLFDCRQGGTYGAFDIQQSLQNLNNQLSALQSQYNALVAQVQALTRHWPNGCPCPPRRVNCPPGTKPVYSANGRLIQCAPLAS